MRTGARLRGHSEASPEAEVRWRRLEAEVSSQSEASMEAVDQSEGLSSVHRGQWQEQSEWASLSVVVAVVNNRGRNNNNNNTR